MCHDMYHRNVLSGGIYFNIRPVPAGTFLYSVLLCKSVARRWKPNAGGSAKSNDIAKPPPSDNRRKQIGAACVDTRPSHLSASIWQIHRSDTGFRIA
jgi:hypothetical protein